MPVNRYKSTVIRFKLLLPLQQPRIRDIPTYLGSALVPQYRHNKIMRIVVPRWVVVVVVMVLLLLC